MAAYTGIEYYTLRTAVVALFFPDSLFLSIPLALTHGEQSVFHVVPQEGHRDEREGGQESASGENDAHKSIVARAERLGAQRVDARPNSVKNAPDSR